MASRCSDTRHGRSSVLLAMTLVAAAVASAPVRTAAPQTSGEEQAQRAAERIAALHRESESLARQERTLLVELRQLEIERDLKNEEFARAQRELEATSAELADAQRRASTLDSRARSQQPDVEQRLVAMYKRGRAGYWRLLLDVDDLRALGRAYRVSAALAQMDRDRIAAHGRTLEELARERTALEARTARLRALHAEAAAAREAAARAVAARSALIASIDARRDLNAQLVGELEAARQKLQAQFGSSPAAAGSLPLRPFRGALPWPSSGVVVGRFGRQPSSRFGSVITRSGIEISVAEGQPVLAVHEGTVAYAAPFTGYGNLVIVQHDAGAYSVYGFLGAIRVARGQRVAAQAPIAQSGRNPSGNPALYFELRIDGKPVDPLQWLQRQ